MNTKSTRGNAKVVAVRMDPKAHAALAGAAKRAKVPVARLARVLIAFGLAKLKQGNTEIERALKGSRDASVRRVVETSGE
jgi:hypothetical protein